MNTYKIALIPGDTVGPELIFQVEKILTAISAATTNIHFDLIYLIACGSACDRYGIPLPADELKRALDCHAVIFGNLGASRYQSLPIPLRPEYTLLEMRRQMSVCTNIRPIAIRPGLEILSPLKPEFLANGFDTVVVRDIQGGMFAGKGQKAIGKNGETASDLEFYDEEMIKTTARIAFETAAKRNHRLTSLDKANVLYSSTLWRKKVIELSAEFPEIQLEHRYIDSASMDVIKAPGQFDVILTNNVFGDIIADELTQLAGTPSFFGSAEIADDLRGIYTPNQLHHPDEMLTGQNVVSPVGILNAVSLMLSHSCGEYELAQKLNMAIDSVLMKGITTPEVLIPGFVSVSTAEFGDEVAKAFF